MTTDTQKTYFISLSGLRCLSAFMIVLHHTLWYFSPNNWLSSLQLGNGPVCLFFILSGFVLYYNYGQQIDYKKYYISRFCRIYPLYLLSLIFFFILVGANHFWVGKPSALEAVSAFLGIQSFFPKPHFYFAINPVGWFVSTEIFLSILFPFMARFLNQSSASELASTTYGSVSSGGVSF